jgi:hypothetical protein
MKHQEQLKPQIIEQQKIVAQWKKRMAAKKAAAIAKALSEGAVS